MIQSEKKPFMEHHSYAQFWKCALQVNLPTYGPRFPGQAHGLDEKSYAEALRDVCFDKEISVVGLADHGSVEGAEVVSQVLCDAGIVVFPGFEIETTEKVHWICLFSEDTTEQELERYLGFLHLTNPTDGARPSDLSGQKLLEEMKNLGGFCCAAHITSNKGILKEGFNNLWKIPSLQAAQIPGSIDDLSHPYKQIVQNKNPDYRRDHVMGIINAKDVANPENLSDPHASCLIKMTRPSFASFLMAFKDPESRVRIADQPQEHRYSRIESIAIESCYFEGLSVEMSPHLNTVIGGRGSGKSTLLECVRYALDVPYKGEEAKKQGEQIVKANLNRAGGQVVLKLRSATNHMQPYKVIRRYGEPPRVIDEQDNESHLHPGRDLMPGVEIYGQNQIYELANNAESSDALTRILDRFLPRGSELSHQLEPAYRALKQNGERLAKTQEKKDEIERKVVQLPKFEEQVRQFKGQGLEEKLKQVPLLEKERGLGLRMHEEIQRVCDAHRQFKEALPDLVFLNDTVLTDLPHAEYLYHGRQLLKELDCALRQKLDEIGQIVGKTQTDLGALINTLNQALQTSEAQLDKEFTKLPALAGQDGKTVGRRYQQLLRDIGAIKPAQAHLKTVEVLIETLMQGRRNLLGDISDMRRTRSAAKQEVVSSLNKRLEKKLRITLKPNGLRQPLRQFLETLPGIGERKTEWVDNAPDLTIMDFIAAIREGKDALQAKAWGLTSGFIETLTRMTPTQHYALEAIDLEDQVNLELNISHTDDPCYRALERLSTGQKCTAILHLLLLDNPDPLLMDQPEDNLDNAFIAERIVQELRVAKIERQFLFATHNANIPVFGDAEWIGICSAVGSDHAEMPHEAQGSVDLPAIREKVADILEGGKEAFLQRQVKYGFDKE